jgi:hypothetical protein
MKDEKRTGREENSRPKVAAGSPAVANQGFI